MRIIQGTGEWPWFIPPIKMVDLGMVYYCSTSQHIPTLGGWFRSPVTKWSLLSDDHDLSQLWLSLKQKWLFSHPNHARFGWSVTCLICASTAVRSSVVARFSTTSHSFRAAVWKRRKDGLTKGSDIGFNQQHWDCHANITSIIWDGYVPLYVHHIIYNWEWYAI